MKPHRQKPTRLHHPWDSLGKNTGVGCHFLLQCMKVKSESEAVQSCPTLCDPMDCSLPGSSVHEIFQARVLEWGAIAFLATKPPLSRSVWFSDRGFPGGAVVKNPPAKARDAGDAGSVPGSERIPWRRGWQHTPVFLPGKSHGQRSLVGYSPWGPKESDTTE